MVDTVNVGRVEMLKCRHFIRDGVLRAMYEEHLDSLKQKLVDTMRSELNPMTQWGVLGEVIPAEMDGNGMEFSMQRLIFRQIGCL